MNCFFFSLRNLIRKKTKIAFSNWVFPHVWHEAAKTLFCFVEEMSKKELHLLLFRLTELSIRTRVGYWSQKVINLIMQKRTISCSTLKESLPSVYVLLLDFASYLRFCYSHWKLFGRGNPLICWVDIV